MKLFKRISIVVAVVALLAVAVMAPLKQDSAKACGYGRWGGVYYGRHCGGWHNIGWYNRYRIGAYYPYYNNYWWGY